MLNFVNGVLIELSAYVQEALIRYIGPMLHGVLNNNPFHVCMLCKQVVQKLFIAD